MLRWPTSAIRSTQLREAVMFSMAARSKTASKTVFSDGNPNAEVIMIIGEAPGEQEDIQGIPFCGPSGNCWIRCWPHRAYARREPLYIQHRILATAGNRQPTPEESLICRPFVEKHIALINPKMLLLAGGVATTALLENGYRRSKLRDKF